MKQELEKILWDIIDNTFNVNRAIEVLPEAPTGNELVNIIGFSAMMLSKPILQAAIEKYNLLSDEFHIDGQYQGKTAIEWLSSRVEQGNQEAIEMLRIMNDLPSMQVSTSYPMA